MGAIPLKLRLLMGVLVSTCCDLRVQQVRVTIFVSVVFLVILWEKERVMRAIR